MSGDQSKNVCPVCRIPRQADDRFCVSCGAILPHIVKPVAEPVAPVLKRRENLLLFALMFIAFPAVIWGGYFALTNHNASPSESSESLGPAPVVAVTTQPLPVSVATSRPIFRNLTPAEISEAERDLPALLGPLWYPGASLNTENTAFVGRTFREGGPTL